MTDETFVECEFIYAGQRLTTDGKLYDALAPIKDGKIGEVGLWPPRRASRVIGGVYKGASFSQTKARGLKEAVYVRRDADAVTIAEWTTRDDEAKSRVAARRLESDEKQLSDIERTMQPVREMYQTFVKRDIHLAFAYEAAVLRALRKPLLAKEKT